MRNIIYRLNVTVPEHISDLFIESIAKFNLRASSLDRFRVPYDETYETYEFSLEFESKSLDDADKIMRLCTRNNLLYGFTPVLRVS